MRVRKHKRRGGVLGSAIGIAIALSLVCAVTWEQAGISRPPVALAAGNNYYVDGLSGSDANSGASAADAWRTLAPVASRTFYPGDTINFRRGSSWGGGLRFRSSGAAGVPITLKAYGTGARPTITNEVLNGDALTIQGDYVVVQDFLLKDAPHGGVYVADGAEHNVVRDNEMTNVGTGASLHGQHTLVTGNYVHDLRLIRNTVGGNDDYGANGVIVLNSNNEISYNRFINCRAPSYDYGFDGGAVEIYNPVTNINIHHNYSSHSDGFMEVGGGSATNVTVAYNVSDDDYHWMALLHLTGTWAATINNFKIENNTIVRTTDQWKILNFDGTPSPSTFFFRNNIVYAQTDVANNASFTHANNLYYLYNGAVLGFAPTSGEKLGDPLFANLGARDYHLQAASPAVNTGLSLGYTLDFDNRTVPAGSTPDMGAFEMGGAPPSPSATPSSTPTWTPSPAPSNTPLPSSTAAPPSATSTPLPPTATAVPGQTSLLNGGFESGLSSWYLPSWFANAASVVSFGAHGGARALRFQGSSGGPYIQQDVAASAGQDVGFSGWVNVPQLSGGASLIVELVARNRYNGDVKTFPLQTISAPTGGWVKISGSAIMPANTAAVRLRVRCPIWNGTAYLDDLSLQLVTSDPASVVTSTPTWTPSPAPSNTPVPPAPSATSAPSAPTATPVSSARQSTLLNGGFESGLSNWYLPSWFASVASVVSSGAHGGARALRFQGSSGGPYIQQDVAASAGQEVDLSGWVNVPQLSGGASLIVELVARNRYNGDVRTFPAQTISAPTGGWLKIVGSAIMPANTAAVRLRVRCPIWNGTAYLDELSLQVTGP